VRKRTTQAQIMLVNCMQLDTANRNAQVREFILNNINKLLISKNLVI